MILSPEINNGHQNFLEKPLKKTKHIAPSSKKILANASKHIAGGFSRAVKKNAQALSKKNCRKKEPIRHVEGISTPTMQTFFSSDNKISCIRQAQPFENCVISGGGAKGLCLAAFLSTLNQGMPFLENLKRISGTSAGSTMALLLAAGLTPEEVDEFLSNIDILDQLRGDDLEDLELGRGLFSGNNLTRTLDSLSKNSACQYMSELIANAPEKLSAIAEEAGYESFIEKATNSFSEGLTFNDLRLLNILNPKKFKPLTITGYNTVSKQVIYYNAENSPDMLCSSACRISIAIPFFFKSVLINDIPHSDGGLGSNVPLETFSNRPDYKPETTMVLAFDNDGKTNQILHDPLLPPEEPTVMQKAINAALECFGYETFPESPQARRRTLPPSAIRILIAGDQFAETKENDAQKLYSKGPGVFIVPHGELGTCSFAAKHETIEEAKNAAREAGRNYAAIYKDHIYHTVYNGAEEALNSLSQEEKNQLKELATQNLNRTDLLSSQKEFYYKLSVC